MPSAMLCTGSNPRQPSQEEMEKPLKCCYYDTDVDFLIPIFPEIPLFP